MLLLFVVVDVFLSFLYILVGGVLLGAIVVLVGGWVYFHQRQQYQVV